MIQDHFHLKGFFPLFFPYLPAATGVKYVCWTKSAFRLLLVLIIIFIQNAYKYYVLFNIFYIEGTRGMLTLTTEQITFHKFLQYHS